MSVKFLAQKSGLSLTGFEPMRIAILRLLVRRVNLSTTALTDVLTLLSIEIYIPHILLIGPHTFHFLAFSYKARTILPSKINQVSRDEYISLNLLIQNEKRDNYRLELMIEILISCN